MAQILKKLGAKVIATAGGPAKVAIVKDLGADHVVNYRSDEGKDWPDVVNRITGGRGVDVVSESVGKDTWEGSLPAVKRKGTIISLETPVVLSHPFPLGKFATVKFHGIIISGGR